MVVNMSLINYVPGQLIPIPGTEKQYFFVPRLKCRYVAIENGIIKAVIDCEWICYEKL